MAELLPINREPPVTQDVALAFRSVARGHGTPAQQKAVMMAILGDLCGLNAIEPGGISDADRQFLAGKRFVGMVAAKWAGLQLWQAPEDEKT